MRARAGTALVVALGLWGMAGAIRAQAPAAIPNLSFEQGTQEPDGWKHWGTGELTWDNQVAHEGRRSLKIAKTDWDTGWTTDPFPVDGSYAQTYPWITVSVWVKAEKASGTIRPILYWLDAQGGWMGNAEPLFLERSNTDWTPMIVSGLPPRGATQCRLILRSDANTGSVWYDDLHVELTSLPVLRPPDAKEDRVTAPYHAFLTDYAQHALAPAAQEQVLRYDELNGKGPALVAEGERLLKTAAGTDKQRLQLRLAIAYRQIKDPDKAIALLEDLLKQNPAPDLAVRATANLGHSIELKGDIDRAIATYQKIGDIDPAYVVEGLYFSGMAYETGYGKPDYGKCKDYLLRARPYADRHPKSADFTRWINYYIAAMESFLGEKEAARTDLQRVLDTDPTSTYQEHSRARLAHMTFDEGRYPEALAEYQALTTGRETEVAVDSTYYVVRCLILLDRLDEIENWIRPLEARDAAAAEWRRREKAQAFEDRHRYQEALQDWEKLVGSKQDAIAIAALRGSAECLLALGRLDEAEARINQLTGAHPGEDIVAGALRAQLSRKKQG